MRKTYLVMYFILLALMGWMLYWAKVDIVDSVLISIVVILIAETKSRLSIDKMMDDVRGFANSATDLIITLTKRLQAYEPE